MSGKSVLSLEAIFTASGFAGFKGLQSDFIKSRCTGNHVQGLCELELDPLQQAARRLDRHGLPPLPPLPVQSHILLQLPGSACVCHGEWHGLCRGWRLTHAVDQWLSGTGWLPSL